MDYSPAESPTASRPRVTVTAMANLTELLDHPDLTTDDVGTMVHASPRTIRRLAERGLIAHHHIGGQYRFTLRDVADYLARTRTPARP